MTKSGQIILPYGDEPGDTPSTGKVALYPKSDSKLYIKNDIGQEFPFLATSSGNVEHSDLTGLDDDDHVQYHTDARGDARYYTQGQVDFLVTTISSSLDEHSELSGLDYLSSGHTGFQQEGDYATNTNLATTSGNIVNQIPTDFYTTAEVDALVTTISGKLDDHNEMNNLDYFSSGHTGFQPEGDYATTAQLTTLSGIVPTTILELTDTPDSYTEGGYLVSTASGIEFKTPYIEYTTYVSPTYVGFSDGSRNAPFKTIYEAADFMYATYSGAEDLSVLFLLPGVYDMYTPINTISPSTKAIIGVDSKSVILKPGIACLGTNMIGTYQPINISNITLDATDISEMKTVSGTVGYKTFDESFEQLDILNVVIRGFYTGLEAAAGTNIYAKSLDVSEAKVGVSIGENSLLDADLVYIYDCDDYHIHAYGNSEVYLEGCELYSWNQTERGTAIYAEDTAFVEVFGGTNIWGCNKNIIVKNEAVVYVDGCVIEPSEEMIGIEQHDGSFLRLLNSRIPLDSSSMYIENSTNVFISSFDLDNDTLSIGKGSELDQCIFNINNGGVAQPSLMYEWSHNGRRALSFQSTENEESYELYVSSVNAEAVVAAHSFGENAWAQKTSLHLSSNQEGDVRGWNIEKLAGENPQLNISYTDDTVVLSGYPDGTITLNSGVAVDKILDEDDFISDDPKALTTQHAIKAYLGNEYYTQEQINSISGTLYDHPLLTNVFSTGLISGGNITINVEDASKFDVSAGSGIIVDNHTDAANPVRKIVTWDAMEAVTDEYLGIADETGIYITRPESGDGVGTLNQQETSLYSEENYRDFIVLGWTSHVTVSGLDDATTQPNYPVDVYSQMRDFISNFGTFNISGNEYSANENLTIQRSAGKTFDSSANYTTSRKSPNVLVSESEIPVSEVYYYSRDISGEWVNNDSTLSGIDPNYYDSGVGKDTVTSGSWTIQTIFYYAFWASTEIQYGQVEYNSKEEALSSLGDAISINPWLGDYDTFRAWLVIRQGATHLDSTDDAVFVTAGKLGIFGSAAGGGSTGESNSASNAGLTGIGLVLPKAGVDLPFKSITSISNKISITDNESNKTLDVDLVPGNISHTTLSGFDSDDHTQYHNDDRGDIRYYTKTEIDTISGTIDSDLTEKFVHRDGSKELTADWDAGDYSITADGFIKENTRVDLASYANITGVLTGGALTINADPTKLNVAAGTSVYVNQTDRNNPTVETLSWDATTINSTLSGIRSKWIGAYRTGPGTAGLITDTDFTQLEKRTVAIIGRYWGDGYDTITGKGNYTAGAFSFGKSMEDIAYALGSINIHGNIFTTSSTSSGTLNRSAGQALRFAGGYSTSNTSPNIIDSTYQEAINTYQYHIQGATSTIIESTVDCHHYDNEGIKTDIPVGKWSAQRIYYFPGSTNIHIVYGQHYYDSMTLAYDGVVQNTIILNDAILEGSVLRAYLILKSGCTDLTDENQARIYTAYTDPGLLPGLTDHGFLGGLDGDDHLQYHNDARGDVRYYTKSYIDTMSGTLDSEFVKTDGTHPLQADWDAGDYTIEADGFIKGRTRVDYASFSNMTGLLTGGNLTINGADHTKINVAAGTSLYVDMSNREDPLIEILSWSDQIYYPSISGIDTKWIGVERTGTGTGQIISSHKFSQSEKRFVTVLGRCWNFIDTDEVTGVGNYKAGAFNAAKSVQDIAYTLGSINISGNNFSATASGVMTLNRSEGEAFRFGANYNYDNLSPNIYTSSTVSGIDSYSYHIQNTASETYTEIQPNYYDLNGVVTPVTSGTWTIQRVYYYPVSNVVLVTYGQYLYDTYDEALVAIPSEDLVLNTGTIEGAILRSFIILKEGCTDLTDVNQAVIIEASSTSAGGSSGVSGGGVTDHGNLTGLGDDDHYQYILHNGTRNFSSTASYTTHPTFTIDTQIVDKKYVDDIVGGLTTDHGSLTGLSDDDHTQYSLTNGNRDYSAIVSYNAAKTFTTDNQIISKKYVDDTVVKDHGNLTGLSDDDHSQYILTTGARTFSNKASYSSHPTFISDVEIVDKKYVDDAIGGALNDHGGLTGLGDDDHTQYHNDIRGDIRYYTKTALDAGQLDNRYYTETEVNVISGSLNSKIVTDHGNLTGLGDDDHTQYLNSSRHGSTALHGSGVVDHNSIGGLQGGASNQLYHLSNAQYTNISGGNPTFSSVTATHYGNGSYLTGISGTIFVQDDYVDVGSFNTLNFKYLNVTNEGGGVASVAHEVVFGTYSAFGSSAGESTTTSNAYQQKLRTTVSGLATGTYRLGWYCEYRCSSISDDIFIRVQQNDVTTLTETNIEVKDNTNYIPHSGFIYLSLSASTTYNFDMDYRNETAGITAYIRNARFEFWRII